jgi:hypothetical protein
MLGNAQAGKPDGQCNREQTADAPSHREVEQARVKR